MTANVRTLGENAGRPHDRELSRKILEIGADLLQGQGYAAFSVEGVAREVGCGKAAIYRRYPGKPALVAAIIESHVDEGTLPDTGSVRGDLLAHALQNQRNQEGVDLATGHGMQAMFEPEIYPILWDSVFRRRRENGLAIITRAIARGELPADTDASVILDTLAGLTLYRQAIRRVRANPRHLAAVIDALVANPPRTVTED